METKNKYKVYIIKSIINDKVYIGFTKHTLKHRLATHYRCAKKNSMNNNKFARAILKYGIGNFTIDLLFECDDKKEALSKEMFYIKEYNSFKDGYNSTLGGEVGEPNKNHADFSGEKNPFYGKKHTEESRKKIGQREYKVGKEHMWHGVKHKSAFKEGEDHPFSIQITIDGVKYGSIQQACKILNLSRRAVLKLADNTN
jgi:group I intron endonuclease